jgi:hypothetical protein
MNSRTQPEFAAASQSTPAAGVLLLCSLTALWSGIAAAESDDGWRYDAVVYGYLPTVGGKTAFPPGDGGSGVGIDSRSLLDSLKMTFMGSMNIRRGRWAAFTDFMYVDFGNSRSGTRDLTLGGLKLPASVSAKMAFDLKGTMWSLAGGYRAFEDAGSTVDLLAGARLLDLTQTITWRLVGNIASVPVADREGNARASLTSWNGVLGLKGRLALGAGGHWFVPYYADLGAGGARITWQGTAGIGYAFESGEVLAAWRYIDYDLGSDGAIRSLTLNGPAIGVAFHW